MVAPARDDVVIVIPARFGSMRFPGKALAPITGADGVAKPLIRHSWEAASAAAATVADGARVIVATDDARIGDTVADFGGEWVMTDSSLRNGTERCHAALAVLGLAPQLAINFQGDAPLIQPEFVGALIDDWQRAPCPMLTPFMQCDDAHAARLIADARNGIVGGTSVVTAADGQALYFSKSPLPSRPTSAAPVKLHVGLYAYTPDALSRYVAAPPSALEEAEALEQLRFLDIGVPIRMVEVAMPQGGLWEVNNPADVAIVETAMQRRRSLPPAHPDRRAAYNRATP